jgi:hypothetical protein
LIIIRDEILGLAAFALWQHCGTEEQALEAVRQAAQENRDHPGDPSRPHDPASEMFDLMKRAHDILKEAT